MINQFQHHVITTFWTKQRVFSEAFEETLSERLWPKNAVASGVIGGLWRYNVCEVLSHLLVTDIAVKPVITNSLKALWQDVLYHSPDELEGRKGFMLDLSGFVITIPVVDGLAVIAFDPPYRDRRRDNILCQVLCQSLSARGHLSILEKSDKALRIFSPSLVDVFFNGRIGYSFSEHFQKVILPFFVHQIIWDVGDRFPLFSLVKSAASQKDMKMRVVMSGASCGLQDDDVSDVEFDRSASVENVFETGIARSHEWTEQCGVAKKPDSQELRHGQYHMAISYARQQSSSDEVCPAVGIHLGTGKTKAGLAGESNSAYFSTVAASVLNKAHLVRIAAAKHFIDSLVVVWIIKAWTELFKCIPMVVKDSFECVFIDAFHGCSLRTTITELAK